MTYALPPLRAWPWSVALALLFGGVVAACSDAEVTSPPASQSSEVLSPVRQVVNSIVFEQLDADGHFVIEPQTGTAAAISQSRALELAVAFMKSYGSQFKTTLERGAGREIDLDALKPMPRVYFAETPYELVAPGLAPGERALVAPAYIVTFSDNRGPAVIMSVSSEALNAYVNDDGVLLWSGEHGNQFRLSGISEVGISSSVSEPEVAAQIAFSRTSAKVAASPQLVWWGRPYAKTHVSWRVILDREVSLRLESGVTVKTHEIFVDRGGSLRAVDRTRPLSPVMLNRRAVVLRPVEIGLNRIHPGFALVPAVVISQEGT